MGLKGVNRGEGEREWKGKGKGKGKGRERENDWHLAITVPVSRALFCSA